MSVLAFHAVWCQPKVKHESLKYVGFVRSVIERLKESMKNQLNLTKPGRAIRGTIARVKKSALGFREPNPYSLWFQKYLLLI